MAVREKSLATMVEEKYMAEGLRKGMQQGIQQGMQQGMQQGRQEVIEKSCFSLSSMGLSESQIAKGLSITETEVREILNR